MKKFWKIFAIVLSAIILVGFGFLFIPNNFAMFNIISQNKEKSKETINSSLNIFEQETIEFYNFESNLFLKLEDNPEIEYTITFKMQKVEDSFQFVLEEKMITEEETIHSKLYFKEGILYVEDIINNSKVKTESDFDVALRSSLMSNFMIYIFPNSVNNIENLDLNVKMNINTSPFYIGQNYKLMSGDTTLNYILDLWGNLRLYKIEQISGEEEIKATTKFFIDKPQLDFPAELDNYDLI